MKGERYSFRWLACRARRTDLKYTFLSWARVLVIEGDSKSQCRGRAFACEWLNPRCESHPVRSRSSLLQSQSVIIALRAGRILFSWSESKCGIGVLSEPRRSALAPKYFSKAAQHFFSNPTLSDHQNQIHSKNTTHYSGDILYSVQDRSRQD